MKRLKNIIIKVNEPSRPEIDVAVMRGVELARISDAKLTLFDVLELPESILSSYADIVSPEELTELIVWQRLDQLTELAKKLHRNGLDVSARVC